jgi:response regulator RpfG family c-di-GMP phosphodiesterase
VFFKILGENIVKIMICDINSDKAKVLEDLLKVYQFKLITLTNKTEFYKKVQDYKPSIIILNNNFIDKSTPVFIHHLRSNPVTSKTPIIYISDRIDEGNILNKFAEDSLIQLIQEPYKIKNLRHYIDRWTTLRSLYIRQ